ncbi:MAG: phosphatase PAP2 family protein [Leptospiraceae bacterium]|nr:phosphatase PAP2 family protein [Leptospiraceae bacterium]MCP5510618.1 phosphatase PAP2 family protein [Leptospiraceae bacterium]
MNFPKRNPIPLLSAFLFHYICYVLMQTMALFSEFRRGPSLPDLILEQIPVNRSLDWINNTVWILGLLSFLVFMSLFRKPECINYLYLGGLISLMRGVFISLTGLGPPGGQDLNLIEPLLKNGVNIDILLNQWIPISIFWGSTENAFYLTQDLMFSGHTSSTFLLVLILKQRKIELVIAILFHVLTVVVLLLTHEHYSIDILAAYFVVYATYSFIEKRNLLAVHDSEFHL